MKALSLTQPWATLIALGAKRIETRSWSTTYRGPIYIHAAKGFPRWARELCDEAPFVGALGNLDPDGLLRGYVVATAHLANVLPTDAPSLILTAQERAFGDYGLGRYAWLLEDITPIEHPFEAKGALGLFDFEAVQRNYASA